MLLAQPGLIFGEHSVKHRGEFLFRGIFDDGPVGADMPCDALQDRSLHIAIEQNGQLIVRVPNNSDERRTIEPGHIYIEHDKVALGIPDSRERSKRSSMKSRVESQFVEPVEGSDSVVVVVIDEENDGRGHGAAPEVELE
jgi:hypothetical protein